MPGQERDRSGRLSQAFYRAASENGGFLDATQAKTRPAAAKAMTDMYRKMAELGVPFATEMKIGIEAEGPMAEMMKKMGNTIIDGSHVDLDRRQSRRRRSMFPRATRSTSGSRAGRPADPSRCCGPPVPGDERGRGGASPECAGLSATAPRRTTGRSARSARSAIDDLVWTKRHPAAASLRFERRALTSPGAFPRRSITTLKPVCPRNATDKSREARYCLAAPRSGSSPSYPCDIGGWRTGQQ